MTCAVTGLCPGVEQLRDMLHPNSPSRCWGALLPVVLRVPAQGQEAQAPACQFASLPINEMSLLCLQS